MILDFRLTIVDWVRWTYSVEVDFNDCKLYVDGASTSKSQFTNSIIG
jgi:hypothetical protein